MKKYIFYYQIEYNNKLHNYTTVINADNENQAWNEIVSLEVTKKVEFKNIELRSIIDDRQDSSPITL